MRRVVSITLLLLVSLPMISPLFAASGAGSTLPACCRRDGTHHCMMPSMDLALTTGDSGQKLTAVHERCPYFPATVQTASIRHLSSPNHRGAFYVPQSSLAIRITQTEALYRISFDRSRQKRGPPL